MMTLILLFLLPYQAEHFDVLASKNLRPVLRNMVTEVMTNKLAKGYNMSEKGTKSGFRALHALHGVVLSKNQFTVIEHKICFDGGQVTSTTGV